MLDVIEADPTMAEPIIAGTGIRRCELQYLAREEMIVRLEDLLRRRSKLELLVTQQELQNREGIRELCAQLFGDLAEARYEEYFSEGVEVPAAAGESA